jgi:hypothetical protein
MKELGYGKREEGVPREVNSPSERSVLMEVSSVRVERSYIFRVESI